MTGRGSCPVAGADSAAVRSNPFDRPTDGVPLEFTIDGRSLAAALGDDSRKVDYLLTLARTPIVDALVLDPPDGFADDLPCGYVAEPDTDQDIRMICRDRGIGGFWGGIQPWSSRLKRADQLGLVGEEREWFLYCETATWFHRTSGRHFYVTADPRLLTALRSEQGRGRWAKRRIVDLDHALKLIGWVMRRRDKIYLQARPGYTQTTTNYDFYADLSFWLAPDQLRLRHWGRDRSLGESDVLAPDLTDAIDARLVDLLKARDGVAFHNQREQNNATLSDILYHLRSAVPTSTALFDGLAVLAQQGLGIDAADLRGGITGVSFGKKTFRKALRGAGADGLADESERNGPLWSLFTALRNPIVHGAGLAGIGYEQSPGPSESRLTLLDGQAECIEAAATWAGDQPRVWGLQDTGFEPLLDPHPFAEQSTAVVLRAADRHVSALATDLGAPEFHYEPRGEEMDRLWKFGLLGGLVPELRSARALPWHGAEQLAGSPRLA